MQQLERRAWPRQRKLLRVLVLDPEDALAEPYSGWVIDRSTGGVCLSLPRAGFRRGSIVQVQPAAGRGTLPWLELKVNNRRHRASRVEIGCHFIGDQVWNRILLLE